MKPTRKFFYLAALLLIAFLTATNPSQAQQVFILHSFGDSSNDGIDPKTGLIPGSDGNFYGTTDASLITGSPSTVYQMTPGGSVTVIHYFTASEGSAPQGVIQGSDNFLYGLNNSGGSFVDGTVYKMSTGGSATVLHNFPDGTGDGVGPMGNLVFGSNNILFGTTTGPSIGGDNSAGTVFQIGTSGNYTLLHDLVGNEGHSPAAGLAGDGTGSLYATTPTGGLYGNGTAFVVSASSGTFSVIYNFGGFAHDASHSSAPLLFSSGSFYGTSFSGGLSNLGTIFKLTPGGSEAVLYNFAGSDGLQPRAGLIKANDGNFYGTASGGGSVGKGVLFSFTPSGTYRLIHNFSDGTVRNDGSTPWGELVQGSDGNLYGTTQLGGAHGDGTVFQLIIGYPGWVAKYGLTGTDALPATVLQPDGLANIIKYSLGLAANATYNPGSPGLPTVQVQNFSGTNYLTLSFTGVAMDVTYNVQASSDLATWTTIHSYSGVTNGPVTVQDTQDVTVSPQRYMRLQVTYP